MCASLFLSLSQKQRAWLITKFSQPCLRCSSCVNAVIKRHLTSIVTLKKNVSAFQLKHCLSHCIKEFYKVEEAHCNFQVHMVWYYCFRFQRSFCLCAYKWTLSRTVGRVESFKAQSAALRCSAVAGPIQATKQHSHKSSLYLAYMVFVSKKCM